jgi:hypothetical protein
MTHHRGICGAPRSISLWVFNFRVQFRSVAHRMCLSFARCSHCYICVAFLSERHSTHAIHSGVSRPAADDLLDTFKERGSRFQNGTIFLSTPHSYGSTSTCTRVCRVETLNQRGSFRRSLFKGFGFRLGTHMLLEAVATRTVTCKCSPWIQHRDTCCVFITMSRSRALDINA